MADANQPKKRASERRRQQNRVAQKNYRERQKQRLQELQELAQARTADWPGRVKRSSQVSSILAASNNHETSPPLSLNSLRDLNTPGGSSFGSIGGGSAASYPSLSASASSELSGIPLELQGILQEEGNKIDEHTRRRVFSGALTITDILRAGLEALSARNSEKSSDEEQASDDDDGSAGSAESPALRTNEIFVLENRMQTTTRTLPCVYSNHLRIKQVSIIAAIRANAEMIGVSFAELIGWDSESPFYQGSAASEMSPDEAFSMNFQHVTEHLRPLPSQTQHRHHPYIDTIPFRSIRQRLIQLLAMDPPMFDEDDFCEDLEKGGLICWGSSLGGGSRATGSGAPWDPRSWEAQPWFLQKWWVLTGGAEGELYQQSKWWHEMRGDRLPAPW
ncbi:hypothetical protein ASPZODRAFT_126478 [Penicilliopsis zonata CBS 506.65]|uniref:BZIP domain-containing protein n=1 Tax=Penicilliopsis zonata CBS 506.65 TaxID=1073090 RepID=A0A1L9STP0_9EURO|nr:hypothetical protein ASPZODRAFT_126478 [Penicilliopsis zonata CBS 506.65]OJJ50585.1 hypothetical protein ASPZODRAFT_126478 [Penicilliopsis zonata CBS 506.65]